ncbi:hypothetical protein PPYR_11278 [Photinus pyralis]|uniref:AB hydrolase-1 domain-containing protein n=1 Tax=Photinus pyralis TaxID=7054 RepID=A0A1Y1LCT0_PHOPY|nr:probable serine hydrolase [Photinus pyralis]KAB0794439.1 hypothetical protein PPYR_11278 [Photinus pyralis]
MIKQLRNVYSAVNGLNRSGKRFLGNRIRTYEEIKIPVPWGHIAGKWWGPQNQRPILAVHGWQDNSGSFDLLIPQLPPEVSVLAVDFPGHGLSTPLPPGIFYHSIDSVITLRRIVKYFEWEKVSLLGHSLGAILCYVYSTMYCDTVDFLICIEGLKPLVFEQNKLQRMIQNAENFLRYDEIMVQNKEPPCYTFDEMEKILHEASKKSINVDKCRYILERNVAPSTREPNKYHFTRDLRLKVGPLLDMAQKDVVADASNCTCPLIMFKCTRTSYVEKKEQTLEVIDVLKKCNHNMEMHAVDGTHHVHLNNPERVSGLISGFIKKYNIHDRSKGGIKKEVKLKKENLVDVLS